MKSIVIYLTVFLAVVSCQSAKEKQKQAEALRQEDASKRYEAEKKQTLDELNSKYGIIYCWDRASYKYSVDYISIIDSGCQIITDFSVVDIYVTDSIRYLSVAVPNLQSFYHLSKDPRFIFTFPITKDQELKLRNPQMEYFLVVKIAKIKKTDFEIKGVEMDDLSIMVDFDISELFKGEGSIIEVKSIKRTTID